MGSCAVTKQVVCLHHVGCPDCTAGSTASMRSELPRPPQLPFTGQSHTASSASLGTASSSQPATSHAATGPATAGLGGSSSSSTRLGTASSNQPATSHAATGPATAGMGSSSSTRLGTASEPTQLSGRSQAGRVTQACSSLLTEAASIWSQCCAWCHIMLHYAQHTSRLARCSCDE